MKHAVLTFKKENTTLIYLRPLKHRAGDTDLEWRWRHAHRIRVKYTLFAVPNLIFTTYHPNMDFTLAISKGWIQQ